MAKSCARFLLVVHNSIFFPLQIASSCFAEKKQKTKKRKIVKKYKKSSCPTKENALAKPTDSEKKDRNISGDDAVLVDRTRKRMKRAVPIVTGIVPIVPSQITSKLTSTRSPLQHACSPNPCNLQTVGNKKSSAKKKRSREI